MVYFSVIICDISYVEGTNFEMLVMFVFVRSVQICLCAKDLIRQQWMRLAQKYVRIGVLKQDDHKCHSLALPLRQNIPPIVVQPESIDFVALCNDLIDYFIVCFELHCNTMRVL